MLRELFRTAARVIHERIGLDQDRVTGDVAEILEVIDEKLYRPDFKAGDLKPSKKTRNRFAEQLEATPHLYLRVRRVEVALYLLDHSDATIPVIAEMVGYPNVFSFIYTFKKLMGRSPEAERRHWRRMQAEDGAAAGRDLIRGHGKSRILRAPIDRLCQVGGLKPRSAAFYLASLRLVALPDAEVDQVGTWMDEYLASTLEGPEARPEAEDPAASTERLSMTEEDKLLDGAARPTRAAFERFEEESPEPIRPMIHQLRENFLTEGYTVEEMRAVLAASAIDLARFTRATGVSPWQYVIEARMETASRLLRDSPLSVQAISFLVGYSDPPQFRRAFKKWSGQLTPDGYRSRVRAVVARAGKAPDEHVHWRFLERVWNRQAVEEAAEMIRHLERVYSFAPCELPG